MVSPSQLGGRPRRGPRPRRGTGRTAPPPPLFADGPLLRLLALGQVLLGLGHHQVGDRAVQGRADLVQVLQPDRDRLA
nr:hypothetical protein [Streptomyces sp. AK02-04a]